MIDISKFPAGETKVTLSDIDLEHFIYCANLKSAEDIMEMLLVCDAAKRLGVKKLSLVIPYFPYARQDRVCSEGESFSLKVMADLVNSIAADEVAIYDPHSDVTPALINNVQVVHQHEILHNFPELLKDKVIICPDAGAEKKIIKLGLPYLMCRKVRDPKTGEILRTEVEPPFPDATEDTEYLIVDDICDGGRTFIEIAKSYGKHHGIKPSQMNLYVTHGIFSDGRSSLNLYFENLYSMNIEEEKLICW